MQHNLLSSLQQVIINGSDYSWTEFETQISMYFHFVTTSLCIINKNLKDKWTDIM